MQIGSLELAGDITPNDWVDWLGVRWDDYVAPVKLVQKEISSMLTESKGIETPASRCDLVRDRFNRTVPQDGTLDKVELENAVLRFYASDWYDRILALEMGEEGFLERATNLCTKKDWNGEPHQTVLDLTYKEFEHTSGPINIYHHGCGHATHILGMATEKNVQDGVVYIANDLWSPTRALIVAMISKYTNIRLFNHWLPPFKVPNAIRPKSAHAICSCEVLEHTVNPAIKVFELARLLEMGGYLFLSTFFNDMDGHDPQHLIANNIYQDSEKWESVLKSAGLEKVWNDPRGVPKIWKKVNETPSEVVIDDETGVCLH